MKSTLLSLGLYTHPSSSVHWSSFLSHPLPQRVWSTYSYRSAVVSTQSPGSVSEPGYCERLLRKAHGCPLLWKTALSGQLPPLSTATSARAVWLHLGNRPRLDFT